MVGDPFWEEKQDFNCISYKETEPTRSKCPRKVKAGWISFPSGTFCVELEWFWVVWNEDEAMSRSQWYLMPAVDKNQASISLTRE